MDGCYHVYLDVGSNIGVQVRKLYEPRQFPNAPIHKIFQEFFGPFEFRSKVEKSMKGADSFICSVGFEPNSHHSKYLKQIEANYRHCHGLNVKFFTETGASNKNGVTQFITDGSPENNEWGGQILKRSKRSSKEEKYEKVKLMRLSEFVNNVVATRRIPRLADKKGEMT